MTGQASNYAVDEMESIRELSSLQIDRIGVRGVSVESNFL